MTSETRRPRISSFCLTIWASPLAPKKIKTAMRASRMLPPSSPMRKKAAAQNCPTAEAGVEQAAQQPPAGQRLGGDQVEDHEGNVDEAEVDEDLPRRVLAPEY